MFKKTFPTPAEHSAGVNICQYIILHHTGTKEGTINGVLDGLYRREDYASCHFVVDTNGDMYKIGNPEDILWHCGESQWGGLTNMNNYSIGIETIGPLSTGGFTYEQQVSVKTLIRHLMNTYNIDRYRVLRHADLTREGSKNMKHWDNKSKSRKVDIAPTFYQPKYGSWADYQQSL